MPHHGHPVAAQNKALNVAQVEWVLRTESELGIASGNFMPRPSEQTAEEAPAVFQAWRLCLVVLSHFAQPFNVKLRRIVAFVRGSGHGCPEPTVQDRLDKTRSDCGLRPPQSQRTPA